MGGVIKVGRGRGIFKKRGGPKANPNGFNRIILGTNFNQGKKNGNRC